MSSTVACNATPARHLWYVNYITPFLRNVSWGGLWWVLLQDISDLIWLSEMVQRLYFLVQIVCMTYFYNSAYCISVITGIPSCMNHKRGRVQHFHLQTV